MKLVITADSVVEIIANMDKVKEHLNNGYFTGSDFKFDWDVEMD